MSQRIILAALIALSLSIGFGTPSAEAGTCKGAKGKNCEPAPTELVQKKKEPTPIDGSCGPAAKQYSHDATGFTGDLCVADVPEGVFFPNQGTTLIYQCPGKNGGKLATCTAGRELSPDTKVAKRPTAVEPVCKFVQVLQGMSNIPKHTFTASGYVTDTCYGTQWSPGLQATIGGGTAQTFVYVKVCKPIEDQ